MSISKHKNIGINLMLYMVKYIVRKPVYFGTFSGTIYQMWWPKSGIFLAINQQEIRIGDEKNNIGTQKLHSNKIHPL